MVATRSHSTVKTAKTLTETNHRTRHTTSTRGRGSSTRGRGSTHGWGRGGSRGGGAATNRTNHNSQLDSSPDPNDEVSQELHNNHCNKLDKSGTDSHLNSEQQEPMDNHSTNGREESVTEDINLTLENFESCLSAWTIPALRQTLAQRKKNQNRIPQEVQEVLNYQKAKYTKIKLMLALIGRVSEKTVNAFL